MSPVLGAPKPRVGLPLVVGSAIWPDDGMVAYPVNSSSMGCQPVHTILIVDPRSVSPRS